MDWLWKVLEEDAGGRSQRQAAWRGVFGKVPPAASRGKRATYRGEEIQVGSKQLLTYGLGNTYAHYAHRRPNIVTQSLALDCGLKVPFSRTARRRQTVNDSIAPLSLEAGPVRDPGSQEGGHAERRDTTGMTPR